MISDELLKEIIDQLNKNQKISEDIVKLVIIGIILFIVEKLFEYYINKLNTMNEKKGDEELYISQKQYDMEVEVFLKFTEERYKLQSILKKIAKNKGKLDRNCKDECENTYNELVNTYNNLTDYLNKYICFVPLDIWNNMMDYVNSIHIVIEEWKLIFQSGLRDILITEKVEKELENVEKKSERTSNCIREYIYRERVILS